MEYVEGEIIANVLRRLRDDIEGADKARDDDAAPAIVLDTPAVDDAYARRVATLFAELADGLQHAHENGVVHRDVKPSNIMVDRAGRLRLLDFGLARLEGDETVTLSGDRVGTPLYMSPEQASVQKIDIDHRADVYSLGVTLYELLTSRTPFRGKDRNDTLSGIIGSDPPPLRQHKPQVPSPTFAPRKRTRLDGVPTHVPAQVLRQRLRGTVAVARLFAETLERNRLDILRHSRVAMPRRLRLALDDQAAATATGSTLSATTQSIEFSHASYTNPMPPRPIWLRSV